MTSRRRTLLRAALAWPGAVLMMVAGATAQQTAVPDLYKPPMQRAVPVKIANGVLLVEGSIASASGTPHVSGTFVLDTATTSSIVDAQTARLLGGQGGRDEKLADKTLQLAGVQVSHRPALVYNLDPLSQQTGQKVVGIAGSDIFQNFAARIDYANQLLTLVVLQSCAVPDDHMHLKVVNGLPFLQASVQGASGDSRRAYFLLDTGQAGPGLVLTSEFVKAHPEIVASGKDGVRVDSLSLGGNVLRNIPATIAPPSPQGVGADLAGVIGGGVLSRFDVAIDLPAAWLTLTPNVHFGEPFPAGAPTTAPPK